MRKKIFMLCSTILFACIAFSQNRTIQGLVMDEKKAPIVGVSVTVKGIQRGVTSNAEGKFSIVVPVASKTLAFSAVGFLKKEISITNIEAVEVIMTPASDNLGEVVVVGYSTVNKSSLSGAVGKVSGAEIANKPVLSFDQALTGKAAGVQINTSSGLVGDNVIIRVRGAASVSSGSQPLIVMDGVPLIQGNQGQLYNPANALADLNPNDIESVEVLKDASAAAIYGSRASAGVILITTKKGKSGQTALTYDNFFGVNQPSRQLSVLNAEQYVSTINQMRTNAGLGNIAALGDFNGDGQNDNTDWQDKVYRNGFTQNHQLTASGGAGRTTFYTSLNYNDFENYMIINRQQRASARLNITAKATDWLEIGIKTQFSRTKSYGLGSGTGGALSGVPFGPLTAYPNVPVFDATGNYYTGAGGNSPLNNTPNPVAVQSLNFDTRDSRRYIGSAYAEATIIKGLKLKSQYNIDYQTSFTDQFWDPTVGDGSGLAGVAQNVYNEVRTWSWFNTLNYITRIGNHDISGLIGAEYTRNFSSTNYMFGASIVDPLFRLIAPANYASVSVTASNGSPNNGLASYFGNLNYGYLGKYFASFNMRTDAYSGFGKSNRWGYFPSGSVAWKISQEKFWKSRFVSDLKLRASYGITGNSNIGDYPSLSTFIPTQYADNSALILNAPGNANLRWEQTAQTNFGADLTLAGKVNITVDYYTKKTRDLILNNPVLATLGFPGNSLIQNIGKIETKGFELSVSAPIIDKRDFKWDVSFNMAWNKNKVIATNSNNDDILGGQSAVRPGNNMSAYYLIRWGGVNPANGLPMFYDAAGTLKQYDHGQPAASRWTRVSDGAVTTAITAADRVLDNNKTPYPIFFGGLTQNIRFRNYDLSVDAQYSFGSYVYNNTMATLLSYASNRNKSTAILNAWNKVGMVTDMPRLFWGENQSNQASTRWLEKGDFVRIRNIQIGYTFPASILKKINFSRLRVYGQIQNAFTITGYKGIDPEANANGNTNIGLGIDNFRPYLARTISFGMNIGL